MNTHAIIDLETLDTVNTAVITSIGIALVEVNSITAEYEVLKEKEFKVDIDIQSCLDQGLTVSGSTIKWWMQQSDEARAHFNGQTYDLFAALGGVKNFLEKHKVKTVWGNSASFDIKILENAFNIFGKLLGVPWPYHTERCFRTLRQIYDSIDMSDYFEGTAHDALEDARWEAEYLCRVANKYKLKL